MISDFARDIFLYINRATLANAIAVFGVASNSINILVYWKIGFKDSISVSLFALSISDLCYLVLLLLTNAAYIPGLPEYSRAGKEFSDLALVFGRAQWIFAFVSASITVWVTIERCTCVVRPLKVKVIFTPKKSAIFILFIGGVLLLWMIYFLSGLGTQTGNINQAFNNTEIIIPEGHLFHLGLGTLLLFIFFLAILISTIVLASLMSGRPLVHGATSTSTELAAGSQGDNQPTIHACQRFLAPAHHLPDGFKSDGTDQISLPPQEFPTQARPEARVKLQSLIPTENTQHVNEESRLPSTSGLTNNSTSTPVAAEAFEQTYNYRSSGPTIIGTTIERRKRKLALMVMAVSVLLLVSYLSYTVCFVAVTVNPQFSPIGR